MDTNHTPQRPNEVLTEERAPVNMMTDRELLEEMVTNSRKASDLVEGFFADLKSGKISPMQMLTGMFKG